METDAANLCQRILEKCRQQGWYDGDLDNPARLRDVIVRYQTIYDSAGNKIVIDNDPDDHPRKTSFAYPPATAEQLLATEHDLGFLLPPLLRILYERIANGGFGPGYGLIGGLDGFCDAGDIVDNYQFHVRHSRLIQFEEYERQGEPVELPETMWPRFMLYLCDWDWGAVSCIECKTGRVYLRLPSEENLQYRLELQAYSLEEWFEQWLRGELNYRPPLPDEPEQGTTSVQLLFEAHSTKEAGENEG